jgi:prevent-host-death family protein
MGFVGIEIKASEFKATCLALLDDVAATGDEITITKYGKPIARLVPIGAARPLDGSVTVVHDDDDLLSVDETWDADA